MIFMAGFKNWYQYGTKTDIGRTIGLLFISLTWCLPFGVLDVLLLDGADALAEDTADELLDVLVDHVLRRTRSPP